MHITPILTTNYFSAQKHAQISPCTDSHKVHAKAQMPAFCRTTEVYGKPDILNKDDKEKINNCIISTALTAGRESKYLEYLFNKYGRNDEIMSKILFLGTNLEPETATKFATKFLENIDSRYRGDEDRREELLNMTLFSKNEMGLSIFENAWNTEAYPQFMSETCECLEDFADLKSRFFIKTKEELKHIKALEKLQEATLDDDVHLHGYKEEFDKLSSFDMARLCTNRCSREFKSPAANSYTLTQTCRCLNNLCKPESVALFHNIPDTNGRYVSSLLTKAGDIEDLNDTLAAYPAVLYNVYMHKDNEGKIFGDYIKEALKGMNDKSAEYTLEAINEGLHMLCCTKNNVPPAGQNALLNSYKDLLSPSMQDVHRYLQYIIKMQPRCAQNSLN